MRFPILPFNPLPSHEGRPLYDADLISHDRTFNPLPSHEGRLRRLQGHRHLHPFNPLPSHEGRQELEFSCPECGALSIHFPLTREDISLSSSITPGSVFQSTSLSRGKTMQSKGKPSIIVLSIHFPLTREDQNHQGEPDGRDPFNPLPSHEGRRGVKFLSNFSVSFNPLPSHEGRPLYFFSGDVNMDFQSTSLSRGKTFRVAFRVASFHFQSTSLSRGKTYWQAGYSRAEGFQSTSLSRGKTHKGSPTGDWYTAFNPLPSHEGRPPDPLLFQIQQVFQSTSLSRGKTVSTSECPS